MAVILDQQDIDVFIGLDVGKSGHHAVALDKAGKKLFDRALAQRRSPAAGDPRFLVQARENPARRGSAGHHRSTARRGRPSRQRSGRLPAGPGHRGIADLHPGQAKTDA
jgi:hypothetical protein